MTKQQLLLFAIVALPAGDVGCARHLQPRVNPDTAQIDRLAASAFGVLQTDGFLYAFATPDCGPTDGPAVTVYLLDAPSDAIPPTTRHIRATVWQETASLARHTFEWNESRGPGVAALCSAGSCVAMKAGRIDFGAVDSRSVDGELDFQFTDGIRVRKHFRGNWRRTGLVCG